MMIVLHPNITTTYCGLMPAYHSVLNVKALVGTFNQEKALVGAFSVIVKTNCETDGALHSTSMGCVV